VRCFIALPLPFGARELLATSLGPLRGSYRGLSWTTRESWHLTLAFLGEIEGPAIEIAAAALDEAAGFGDIAFTFGGLGTFPPRGALRVLYARIEDGGRSAALQRRIGAALKGIEAREPSKGAAFTPHVTLARARSRGRGLGPTLPQPRLEGTWTIDRCSLYKSLLQRSGAVYTELRGVDLSIR
jgi:RNA 2',3'-cyclic 3'-phosphodiesterase